MEKKLSVEEYIAAYTKRCSNEFEYGDYEYEELLGKDKYVPWLTPDNARAVAKIAREEVIEKALDWAKARLTDRGFKEFKKYMEE